MLGPAHGRRRLGSHTKWHNLGGHHPVATHRTSYSQCPSGSWGTCIEAERHTTLGRVIPRVMDIQDMTSETTGQHRLRGPPVRGGAAGLPWRLQVCEDSGRASEE